MKCDFFQTKVLFLGHIVAANGLQVDPGEVKVVQKFPVSKNQTEPKSFLDLASYYRRYVPNVAAAARPLHKASEFHWRSNVQEAIEDLKGCLRYTQFLAFPSLQKPFIFYTDASQLAMGAVLAQEHDGLERATCYASKALFNLQSNYSLTLREHLLIACFAN